MSGIVGGAGSRSGIIGAITADVTISADITADNYASLNFSDNVNNLDKAGLYNVSYAATNNPSGTFNWTYVVIEGASGGSVVSQLAIRDTGAIRYTRSRDSGSWSGWRSFSSED